MTFESAYANIQVLREPVSRSSQLDTNEIPIWDNTTKTLKESGVTSQMIGTTVVSADTTAENDVNYTLIGSAVFDDPVAPINGKGFTVFIQNGSATVGGVVYSISGAFIVRTYYSGVWYTKIYIDQDQVSQTAFIKALLFG